MAAPGIFEEIHDDIPRGGPGDAESTNRALAMIGNLPHEPRILDIGCGPGMQTIELSRATGGSVTALDLSRTYLDKLDGRAVDAGIAKQIGTVQGSMFALPFADASFDLIWSEGAIYIIGFEKGLTEWKRLLRDGGHLAVTHLSWLQEDIPPQALDFWRRAYPPGVQSITFNLAIAERLGFRVQGHFTLPPSAWWNDYYSPLEEKLASLRAKHAACPAALTQIEETQAEIDLYRRYSDYYGYVFYVLTQRE